MTLTFHLIPPTYSQMNLMDSTVMKISRANCSGGIVMISISILTSCRAIFYSCLEVGLYLIVKKTSSIKLLNILPYCESEKDVECGVIN